MRSRPAPALTGTGQAHSAGPQVPVRRKEVAVRVMRTGKRVAGVGVALVAAVVAVATTSYAGAVSPQNDNVVTSHQDGLRRIAQQRPLALAANTVRAAYERAGYAGYAGIVIEDKQ